MGTTAQKLQAIANSKAAIKAAIEAKGVSGVGNVLSDYATKISEIPSGGSTDEPHTLRFLARKSGSTIQISPTGNAPALNIEYSINGGSWQTYSVGTTITLQNIGDILDMRCPIGQSNGAFGNSSSNKNLFYMSGLLEMRGKLCYLMNSTGTYTMSGNWSAFSEMFKNCGTSLCGFADLSEFGGTLTQQSFYSMFEKTGIYGARIGVNSSNTNRDNHLEKCFSECYSLNTLEFPNLTNVGSKGIRYLCEKCYAVNNVSFPNLTTMSGDLSFHCTFRDCRTLNIIEFPKLQTIGDFTSSGGWQFQNCYELQYANFPKLTSIGNNVAQYMFTNCSKLKSVDFSMLSNIGTTALSHAFNNCTALEVVHFDNASSVPAISSDTFSNTNNTFKVVVPDALYSTWITASNWSAISSHIVKASEYTPAS